MEGVGVLCIYFLSVKEGRQEQEMRNTGKLLLPRNIQYIKEKKIEFPFFYVETREVQELVMTGELSLPRKLQYENKKSNG